MADFITRMAERALGTAPAAQPLVASIFAPDSASPAWDEETTMFFDPESRSPTPTLRPPPARDEPGTLPEAPHAAQNRDAETGSKPPSGPLDASSRPRPAAPRLPEHRAEPGQGNRDDETPPGRRSARRAIDASGGDPGEAGAMPGRERWEALPAATSKTERSPVRPAPKRVRKAHYEPAQDVESARRATPEDVSSDPTPTENGSPRRSSPRPSEASVDEVTREVRVAPVLPDGRSSVDSGTESPRLQALAQRPGEGPAPSEAALVVSPRTVRPRLESRDERDRQGPAGATMEPPAPTIRVEIGRVEVRALVPPPSPPPAQRAASAGAGLALSLDDYLKQRNGGRR